MTAAQIAAGDNTHAPGVDNLAEDPNDPAEQAPIHNHETVPRTVLQPLPNAGGDSIL